MKFSRGITPPSARIHPLKFVRTPTIDPFAEGIDELRLQEIRSSREAARWHEQIAEESATWLATILDLAEARSWCEITTRGGRTHTATISAVGSDVLLLDLTRAGQLLVSLAAVTSLSARGRGIPARTDRAVDASSMHAALTDLAGMRREVGVVTASGSRFAGQLRSVGIDVLSIQIAPEQTTFLPLSGVEEVSFDGPERRC